MALNGKKYKVNFSHNEETAQKIQYHSLSEGLKMNEKFKIIERTIDLLYDVNYNLKQKGISVLNDDICISEILKNLDIMK